MLHLYQSNHLENLSEKLIEIIATPLARPLQAERVVVQNPGIERWLSQQIAQQSGIAANLSFALPASFIWDILEACLGRKVDISAFHQESLMWKILDQLQHLGDDPLLKKPADYIKHDPDGRKAYQLAQKLAELFDQYLLYRPKMILDWEQNKPADNTDSRWQAALWRKLNPGQKLHWAALLRQFHRAADMNRLITDTLPQRICFFGVGALAPAYLEIIRIVSEFTEIHLFQLSPCETYWDDILPERILAIKRKQWRERLEEFGDYYTSGNPLLASMGLSGQEFARLLADLNPLQVDLYQAPQGNTLLAKIQADIIAAEDRGKTPPPVPARLSDDQSLAFHVCHSPMREIQILHNRLLDLFANDATLTPADILVMAPDINRYAPLIGGVFDSAEPHMFIPWSITDLPGDQNQAVINAFTCLLELPGSRYSAPQTMALLENPAIMAHFGIAEAHLDAIRDCIAGAGARWGLDQTQRRKQGLADSPEYTWLYALQRLLMSYLCGQTDEAVAGILPADGRLIQSEQWLGGLADFTRALQWLESSLNETGLTPLQWQDTLQLLVQKFLVSADDLETQPGLRQIRETLLDMQQQCQFANFRKNLSLTVVRSYLLDKLSQSRPGQGFLKGGVSFCKMTPLRALPFKVIWLLGMNDTAYPRSQNTPAFDLIEADLQLGDRSRRDSDHYLFLETLLSARQSLNISWLGRHPKSNDERPPAVVVAELRDYIDQICTAADPGQPGASNELTTEHPLQAFSRRCFDGTAATASYAAHWLPQAQTDAPDGFITEPLDAIISDGQTLDINELLRFWSHPVRYFAQQRLGLDVWQDEHALQEAETFAVDALANYSLKQALIAKRIEGRDIQSDFLRLQASASLPYGEFGRESFHMVEAQIEQLLEQFLPYTRSPSAPASIDLNVAGIQLGGVLNTLDETGQYSFRLAKIKGKDILLLWIRHLLFLLSRIDGVAPVSRHFGEAEGKEKIGIVSFSAVEDPLSELQPLLDHYRQGMRQPLHFYPQTSFVTAQALHRQKPHETVARNTWRGNQYNHGEQHDLAYQICFRGMNEAQILDQNFLALSDLYQAALEHMERD